jgi:transcriptional regulator with XRE-family HTH domain
MLSNHPGDTMNLIKTRRKDMGLTQEEFAELIGVDRVTVSRWERGTNRPVGLYAQAVADVLGISREEFLGQSRQYLTK